LRRYPRLTRASTSSSAGGAFFRTGGRFDLAQERLFLNLVFQLKNNPLREARADSGRTDKDLRVLSQDGRSHRIFSHLPDQRQPNLRPASLYTEQQIEQPPLKRKQKTVQGDAVLTKDLPNQKHRFFANHG